MPAPTTLRSLLLLFWLTGSAAAQDTPSSPNDLSVPGLPQQAPPPSVIDTVNLFRGHHDQQTRIDNQLSQLAANNDVDIWLVTVSFQTEQSPAQEAAEIVDAWSGDRPAIVLVYIRGKHSTGIAANSSLQEIVPSFELAGLLPPSEDASSAPDPDFAPDTEGRVNRLVETTQRIAELVQSYTEGKSQPVNQKTAGPDDDTVGTDQEKVVAEPVADAASPASSRRAESMLLIAVLFIAALIVWFTVRAARCS